MVRRVFARGLLVVVAAAAGYAVYAWATADPSPVPVAPPTSPDSGDGLPTAEQFAEWARTDPVRMLRACVARYEREGTGFRATMEKRERLNGELYPPEVVRVAVREKPTAVSMRWVQGARPDFLGVKTVGVVYADGTNGGEIVTWRPEAAFKALREKAIDPKGSFARAASRYCIRDAGFLPTMLRTYRAWQQTQAAGVLKFAYRGLRRLPQLDHRPCHVIERTCVRREADSFSLDEAAPTDAKRVERDGFDAVVLMVDAERWLQVGSALTRANGDLIGEYYFRDVELNPAFAADQFTPAALKGSP